MDRDYSMELEFKEPLTEEETSFLKERMLFWGITKKSDGLYHIVWENDYPLYELTIIIGEEWPNLAKKMSKCIINNCLGESDDVLAEMRENREI